MVVPADRRPLGPRRSAAAHASAQSLATTSGNASPPRPSTSALARGSRTRRSCLGTFVDARVANSPLTGASAERLQASPQNWHVGNVAPRLISSNCWSSSSPCQVPVSGGTCLRSSAQAQWSATRHARKDKALLANGYPQSHQLLVKERALGVFYVSGGWCFGRLGNEADRASPRRPGQVPTTPSRRLSHIDPQPGCARLRYRRSLHHLPTRIWLRPRIPGQETRRGRPLSRPLWPPARVRWVRRSDCSLGTSDLAFVEAYAQRLGAVVPRPLWTIDREAHKRLLRTLRVCREGSLSLDRVRPPANRRGFPLHGTRAPMIRKEDHRAA